MSEIQSLEKTFSFVLDSFFRKKKRWLDEEITLFYTVLEEVNNRDCNNWVILDKQTLLAKLGLEDNADKLSQLLRLLMRNSNYNLPGDTASDWEEVFLITKVKVTDDKVKIQFDKECGTLSEELAAYFADPIINKVKHFKSRYAVALYKDLMKNYTKSNTVLSKAYLIKDLKSLFGLDDEVYMRKTEKRLDVNAFKSRTLDYAVKDINADSVYSGMYIEAVTAFKEYNATAGFVVSFRFIPKK